MESSGIADVNGDILLQDSANGRTLQFTRDELKALQARRNDIPFRHLVVSLVLVFAIPVLFAVHPTWWMGIACVLVSVHTFNRFAQIVHGSDHSGLFVNPDWNIYVGRLAGYFLGYTRDGHKAAHNEHHLYLNTERDADRVWCQPEAKVGTIARGWLNDFFLISGAKRFWQYAFDRSAAKPEIQGKQMVSGKLVAVLSLWPAALLHAVILLAYWITSGPQYYFLFYVLPLATLYPAQIRLRSNVEHGFDPGFHPQNDAQRKVTRSIKANWLERFVMAPLFIEYHYEHHVLPTMPYYNAPAMRKLLAEKGIQVPVANGYLGHLLHRWRLERALSATG